MGEVRVESPFPASAWPRVWAWMQDFRGRVADDYAPGNQVDFVERCLERAAVERSWGVYRDGELCGYVSYQAESPVAGVTHALFRKDFWGRETTSEGLRLVYGEIFAAGARKIVGPVFADNNAIIALGMKLGAKREGRLRAQTMRGGRMVDMVLLGLTKEDFDGLPCLDR